MTSRPSETAPRRVDARRNRDRILEVARAAFAGRDADVSMIEIARRANVGSATLYRNFPSKRELLEALYVDDIDTVCAAANDIEADSPGAALTAWLWHFYTYFKSKRPVATELLQHTDAHAPVFGAGLTRVLDAGRPLADDAHASGELRTELSLEQVLDMVAAIAKIPGDETHREPILRAALDALRPM